MKFITPLKQKILGNRFLHFGIILTALHIFSGGLGYIYQIVIGRILHPVEFALFSSIMGLFMFFSAPMAAISMLLVRKVSELKAFNNFHL